MLIDLLVIANRSKIRQTIYSEHFSLNFATGGTMRDANNVDIVKPALLLISKQLTSRKGSGVGKGGTCKCSRDSFSMGSWGLLSAMHYRTHLIVSVRFGAIIRCDGLHLEFHNNGLSAKLGT